MEATNQLDRSEQGSAGRTSAARAVVIASLPEIVFREGDLLEQIGSWPEDQETRKREATGVVHAATSARDAYHAHRLTALSEAAANQLRDTGSRSETEQHLTTARGALAAKEGALTQFVGRLSQAVEMADRELPAEVKTEPFELPLNRLEVIGRPTVHAAVRRSVGVKTKQEQEVPEDESNLLSQVMPKNALELILLATNGLTLGVLIALTFRVVTMKQLSTGQINPWIIVPIIMGFGAALAIGIPWHELGVQLAHVFRQEKDKRIWTGIRIIAVIAVGLTAGLATFEAMGYHAAHVAVIAMSNWGNRLLTTEWPIPAYLVASAILTFPWYGVKCRFSFKREWARIRRFHEQIEADNQARILMANRWEARSNAVQACLVISGAIARTMVDAAKDAKTILELEAQIARLERAIENPVASPAVMQQAGSALSEARVAINRAKTVVNTTPDQIQEIVHQGPNPLLAGLELEAPDIEGGEPQAAPRVDLSYLLRPSAVPVADPGPAEPLVVRPAPRQPRRLFWAGWQLPRPVRAGLDRVRNIGKKKPAEPPPSPVLQEFVANDEPDDGFQSWVDRPFTR